MKLKRVFKIMVVFLIVLLSIPVGLFLFRNPIADYLLEKGGTTVAGARVEVDGIDLDLFHLSLGWERLQVTDRGDTWKNILETGKCTLTFEWKPLLAGKVIIREMNAGNLRTGTPRSTDGKIVTPEKDAGPEEGGSSFITGYVREKLERERANIPVLNLDMMKEEFDVRRMVEELELKTPGKIEELRRTADEKYRYWDQKFEENNYKTAAKEIRQEIKALESAKLKTAEDIEKSIAAAQRIARKSDDLLSRVKKDRKELKEDLKQIRELKEELPRWVKEDFQTVRARAASYDVNVENIGSMLFGERVTHALILVMDTLEKVRENSRKLAELEKDAAPGPEKETGVRPEDKMPELPRFWIKKLALSFATPSGLLFNGTATDISSSMEKTGKPVNILLAAEPDRYGPVKISGTLAHTGVNSKEVVEILLTDIPLTALKLTEFPLVPEKTKEGRATARLNLTAENEALTAHLQFNADDLHFDLNEIKNENKRIETLSRNIAAKIKHIQLTATLKAEGETAHFDLQTNLDRLIYGEIKDALRREARKAKKELELAVDEELDGHLQELESFLADHEKELTDKMGLVRQDALSSDQATSLKLKELEDKFKEKVLGKARKEGERFFKKFKF